jgi:SSS family solute:Na+ symporter
MTPVLAIICLYLGLVLFVGFLGHRLFKGTGEDYFLASRSIGPFILLMTLFGTNMTAFTMLGASGEAYRSGINVFLLMGSSSAIVIPFVFYFVGTRLWWLGKRHGFLTQAQFLRARYQSDALGLALFVVLITLLLPYVLIGVKGGGDVLNALTGGPASGLPPWVGSTLMCGVIFTYVTYGGMRSTAWVNTLQTVVFMSVGALAFFVIVGKYGGLGQAMTTVSETRSELLVVGRGSHEFLRMASYLLIPLSTGVFPHIFSHWLSAKSAETFRSAIVFYPLCITAVWVPSVLLGVVGNIDFAPPLQGPILVNLILQHSGGVLAGLLAAGVFAAIMSSLDSQTLSTGTMFTTDIVRHYTSRDRLSETQQVLVGRLFVASLLVVVLVLSLVTSRSIFSLGVWSLSGFAALFPIIVGALYWRRSTAAGALSAVITVAVLWVTFLVRSLGVEGEYTVGGSGLMPVVVMFAGAAASFVFVSWFTDPPNDDVINEFFPT